MSNDAGGVVPIAGVPDSPSIPPRVNGRYRIVTELGTGALGTVCLAEDEATGYRVAIRLLPKALARSAHATHAVQRMISSIVATSMAHPGLVRVLDTGQAEDGRPFVATEFVEGRRLSEVLVDGKALDVETALRVALDLGGSVEVFHSLGLIHGAVRPRNVMLLEDGRVKLMDVELADLRTTSAMGGVLTMEPPAEYLSPEQIRQAPVTEKTDVYSFAIVLYEMLCGVPPFRAATREAILDKQLMEPAARMRKRRRGIPVEVERIVLQALSKNPEQRPFMPEVLDGLVVKPPWPTRGWRRAATLCGSAALAAAIVVALAWGVFALRPPPPRQPAYSAQSPEATPVPMNLPQTSTAPVSETQPTAAAEPAPPVAVPPAMRAIPPPSASPIVRAERRRPPQAPQIPAAAEPERPPASGDTYDPAAVIDWLLTHAARRGQ